MTVKKGEEIGINWNGTFLQGKKSSSFDGSTDSIDTTNDDDAGFKSSLPGDIGATVSFSGVYDPTHTVGAEDLKTDWISKTEAPLQFGGKTAGDNITTAQAYISAWKLSGNHGESSMCDVTFTITGAIADDTVV